MPSSRCPSRRCSRCSTGHFPAGNQNYWKSTFLRELSDEAIDVLFEHANRATSTLTAVVIEYYGGAVSRVGVSETAFAHREAQYDVGILAQWSDPRESDLHIDWTRGLADALRPSSSGAYLLNFLDNTIRAAFGRTTRDLSKSRTSATLELLQHQPEYQARGVTGRRNNKYL